MNIKIALRLSCTSFSRKSHKQITLAEDLMGIPVQVIFVDIEIGHILLSIPVKTGINHIVEGTIQLVLCEKRRLLLDLFVIVNDLINVNVILAVCIIEDNKLTRNSSHDVAQSCLNQRQKEIRILLRHTQVQTQVILQIFCRHTKLHIQTICCQTMYAECIDNLHCHRLICRLRECTGDNILQLLACTDDTADSRITLEKAIGFNSRPVIIKRDDSRCILRHSRIENAFDGR